MPLNTLPLPQPISPNHLCIFSILKPNRLLYRASKHQRLTNQNIKISHYKPTKSSHFLSNKFKLLMSKTFEEIDLVHERFSELQVD